MFGECQSRSEAKATALSSSDSHSWTARGGASMFRGSRTQNATGWGATVQEGYSLQSLLGGFPEALAWPLAESKTQGTLLSKTVLPGHQHSKPLKRSLACVNPCKRTAREQHRRDPAGSDQGPVQPSIPQWPTSSPWDFSVGSS